MRDKEQKNPIALDNEPSSAAARALAEAAKRRELADKAAAARDAPKERGRRKGPDPVRYGDWEKRGIASDF